MRFSVLSAALLVSVSLTARADLEPLPELQMLDDHPTISRNVSTLIEELHYTQPSLNNSISSAIFDEYLDMLDGNRQYFLASDVALIGRYRYQFDDFAKSGTLEPIFNIFNLYLERRRQRIEYALSMLESEPDFTLEEEFRPDRSELSWPSTEEELDELWRKIVKYDALNAALDDKSWEETVELLTKRYERAYKNITQITATDVFDTFMNAVTQTVDPHSSYLSPRQSEEYRIQMSLSYDGIGASLKEEDDYVTVSEIIPGGPAEIDGTLQPNDRITAIAEGSDGEFVDVVGWRLDEVVERIRGPGGTTVRLRLLPSELPPGSTQPVLALTRDKIKLEERAAQKNIVELPFNGHDYKIGVIEVSRFYQDFAARSGGADDYTSTSRDVARLIGELEAEGIDGLIMDLRQNGGGHLSEATELSGLFIDRGPVVQLKETRRNPQELPDPSSGALYDGPLAVLVDRYSASASEIFAAAIQDYERGVIVGQQTFGKGTVQNLFNLDQLIPRGSNYGQLTLTIGKYYRVTGESTQHRGVYPDIELPSRFDVEQVGESTRDTALAFDRILATDFQAQDSLDSAIAYLRDQQSSLRESDPDLEFLWSDVRAAEAVRDRELVSLNLQKRQQEIDLLEQAAIDRENARRQALGRETIKEIEEIDDTDSISALLLRQTARIVAEMAELASGGSSSELLSNSSAD